MRYILLVLYSLLSASIEFIPETLIRDTAKPLFVSLGSFCEPAGRMKELGLREMSFPFDWLVSKSQDKLIQIFNEDFELFLDPRYLIRHEEGTGFLRHTEYDLVFFHEGDPPLSDQLEALKIKYSRRIERFRNLNSYPGKVVFLRASSLNEEITVESARKLRGALEQFFPDLDFDLCLISYNETLDDSLEKIAGVHVLYFNPTLGPSEAESRMNILQYWDLFASYVDESDMEKLLIMKKRATP